MSSVKRNGKIELFRFVFCISVLLYHVCKDVWDGEKIFGAFSFFDNGRTGVEFFFLVSGYLAAKKAYESRDDTLPIGESTFRFIFSKIKSVFLPHLIINICIIIFIIFIEENQFEKILDKFPSIFFLQRSGISMSDFSSVEWYICSMLLALSIIYPMLKKNYDITARVIAPVGSVMIMGTLVQHYNLLPQSKILRIDELTYSGNYRAFAVVLLGVFCYEISRRIRNYTLTKQWKILLIIVENLCWIISVYYIVSPLDKKYEGFIALIIALAVTLCFSRDINTTFYNNKFVYFLGKISLPIYLSQNLVRMIAKEFLADVRIRYYVAFDLFATIIIGIALYYVCIYIRKMIYRKKK